MTLIAKEVKEVIKVMTYPEICTVKVTEVGSRFIKAMLHTSEFRIVENYNSHVLALLGVFGHLREAALEPYLRHKEILDDGVGDASFSENL